MTDTRPRIDLSEATSSLRGKKLDVRWDDCCAGGQFISTVLEVHFDPKEPDYVENVQFENGVILDGSLWGYEVYEVFPLS